MNPGTRCHDQDGFRSQDLVRHVMARGNGRMSIFLDDTDYRQFVHLLGDVVEDLEIQCWNYCRDAESFPRHAAARPCRTCRKRSRRINGRYAQWWNRRHGRVGHVFQGRFKDQIVQREGLSRGARSVRRDESCPGRARQRVQRIGSGAVMPPRRDNVPRRHFSRSTWCFVNSATANIRRPAAAIRGLTCSAPRPRRRVRMIAFGRTKP